MHWEEGKKHKKRKVQGSSAGKGGVVAESERGGIVWTAYSSVRDVAGVRGGGSQSRVSAASAVKSMSLGRGTATS